MHNPDATQLFEEAKNHANSGRNEDFLKICQNFANQHINDECALLEIATLLLSFGFPSASKKCLDQILSTSAIQREVLLSKAHCELQLGNLEICEKICSLVKKQYPNDLSVLQHLIYFSEYVHHENDAEHLALPKEWGHLAIKIAGGPKLRPSFRVIKSRPLRIGYVSADICQHTVGILLKEIVANHNHELFSIYCYSSGKTKDWVTNYISRHAKVADVSMLADGELVELIKTDEIDILIDLSGHTGRSRLAVFAHRPAPIMASMLGYYASTGLEYMDACFLDQWHANDKTQSQFIEHIIQLPTVRWPYYPAFPAPDEASPPALKNGYITFGSFNNTLKYSPEVYALWAKVLHEVPNSKLILKWRTFNDAIYRMSVINQFSSLGIDSSRLDLRGPSFHIQMLSEYQDVDIGLDPFPFSGGVTSCEALYMGVPVITLPLERVVSRQTFAFLSSIGHSELMANSKTEYLSIAKELATNFELLTSYRSNLRMRMLASPLMQAKKFTQGYEKCLIELYEEHGGS